MVKMSQGQAAPTSPTDESKIPHYFGPWTNWALSPLTLPDAIVTITGDGTGAEAVATVGGNGVVTGITVVNPGSGYTNATVTITGAGTGAAATATLTNTGAIVAVAVTANGGGYKAPVVAITGGGATTDATATAYGGVDVITVQNAGTGYQFPTVDFDMPDDPAGTQAQAHAMKDANGAITSIVIDNPGSGYATAPHVVIRDGTLLDPIANGGSGASAVTTIDVQAVAVDTFGAGYTSAPTVTISDSVGNGSGATATASVDNGLVSAIAVTAPGTGYITPGGIKKFQDQLPDALQPRGARQLLRRRRRQVPPRRRPRGEDVQRPQRQADQVRRVRDRPHPVPQQVQHRPAGDAGARLRPGGDALLGRRTSGRQPALRAGERAARRHQGAGHDRRPAGLRRHRAAVARADPGGDQGQARPRRLPQPAAHRLRRRPLPADRQHAHGLRHGPHGPARPGRRQQRAGRGAQPDLHRRAQVHRLLQGQPRHAAPSRRHQPVDQRRHAAPVDHAGQRGHPVAGGRGRQVRARHAGRQRPA